MNPPLPKPAEKRGDTVPEEAFVDGTPQMVDMPATKEERIAQAQKIDSAIKSGIKFKPTPGTFTYLSPEYRRERAQSALDTYQQALDAVIAEDPESTNAQIAQIVKGDLDTHFKERVAKLQKALTRTKAAEADRAATQREIYSGKRIDSLFVGKEIKRPDIEKVVTKSLSEIVEKGESDETETIKEAKANFVSALEDELAHIAPVEVHTSDTSPAETAKNDTPATPNTALGGALLGAIEKTKAEGGNLEVIQTPSNPDLNEQGFYKKSEHILRPEARKDLPFVPDMKPGKKVLLQNTDTLEIDTWTIESLEGGRVTLKRVVDGKEETRTYPAGELKDIMRLNTYYENALPPKDTEVKIEQEEPKEPTRKVLRAQWREKQNLGKNNFIKPTAHIQRPETAEDLPDIRVIKPGQVITLQDKKSLEIAKWTVAKIENGIAFIEREKDGGEKEERSLSIDSLREILKTNLYYENALRAEEEPAQEQKEHKQELKVGDTINLLNKAGASVHMWVVESILEEQGSTRVYLTSKDKKYSLNLKLEDVLLGIEETKVWKSRKVFDEDDTSRAFYEHRANQTSEEDAEYLQRKRARAAFTAQQNQEKPKEGESKKAEMGPDGMPSGFEAVYEKLAETQGWAQKEVDTLKKDLSELSLTHSHYAVKMIRANIIKRDLLKVVEQLHNRMEDYVSYAETYEDFFRESANGTFAIDDDKRVKSVRFVQTLSSTKKLIDEIPVVTEQVFKAIDERLQKPDINIAAAPTFTYTYTRQPGGNQSPRQEPPSQEDLERAEGVAQGVQRNAQNRWGLFGSTLGNVATVAVLMLSAFGISKYASEKEVSAAVAPPAATKTAEEPSKVTQWNHPEWFQNINESKQKDIARMIGRTDSKQFLRSFIINPDMEGKPIATPQSYESIYNTIGLKANVPYAAYFDTEREIIPETAVQVNNSYFDLRMNMAKAIKSLIEAQDSVGLGARPELPKVEPMKGESFKEYFERVRTAIASQLQKKDNPYQV